MEYTHKRNNDGILVATIDGFQTGVSGKEVKEAIRRIRELIRVLKPMDFEVSERLREVMDCWFYAVNIQTKRGHHSFHYTLQCEVKLFSHGKGFLAYNRWHFNQSK